MSKKSEEDLKKITFDKHVDDNKVKNLNIDNKDILHLNNGEDLSHNIGVQHEQEGQHNHFGGPVVNKHQPNHHLEGHNEGNNIDKEVDEVAEVVEEMHLLGDDESSTDKNFDLIENAIQLDESEDGSEYESALEMSDAEDDVSVDDPAENPVQYTQCHLC